MGNPGSKNSSTNQEMNMDNQVDMDITGNTRRIMIAVPDEPVYDYTREVNFGTYIQEAQEQETEESFTEIYGIHSVHIPDDEEDGDDIVIEIEVQHIGKLLHDYALWVVHTVNYQLTNE